MVRVIRRSNFFEKLIFIVGLAVVVVGIVLIHKASIYRGGIFEPDVIIAIITWLILIFVLIISALSESAREDLATIVAENSQELKLLRKINHDQLVEMRQLRYHLEEQKK